MSSAENNILNNKKVRIGIVAAIAVILVAVLVVVLFFNKNDDKEDPEDDFGKLPVVTGTASLNTPVPTPTLVPTNTPTPTITPAPTNTPIPTNTPTPTKDVSMLTPAVEPSGIPGGQTSQTEIEKISKEEAFLLLTQVIDDRYYPSYVDDVIVFEREYYRFQICEGDLGYLPYIIVPKAKNGDIYRCYPDGDVKPFEGFPFEGMTETKITPPEMEDEELNTRDKIVAFLAGYSNALGLKKNISEHTIEVDDNEENLTRAEDGVLCYRVDIFSDGIYVKMCYVSVGLDKCYVLDELSETLVLLENK